MALSINEKLYKSNMILLKTPIKHTQKTRELLPICLLSNRFYKMYFASSILSTSSSFFGETIVSLST